MKKSQSGFTLVELVVVILILGILGATALPRFMDVNTQAHHAAVAGAGGGVGAGVALVHAQWVANGSDTTAAGIVNVAGFGSSDVEVNTSGWPTDTAGANTITSGAPATCVNIWNGIMQNPPTVVATATTADYSATAPANDQCLYTYTKTTGRTITYDATSGGVTLVNP